MLTFSKMLSALILIAAARSTSCACARFTSAVMLSALTDIFPDSSPSACEALVTSAVMLSEAIFIAAASSTSCPCALLTSAVIELAFCIICDCNPFSTSVMVDFVSSTFRSSSFVLPLSCIIEFLTEFTFSSYLTSPFAVKLSLRACMPFRVRLKMYDSINSYFV